MVTGVAGIFIPPLLPVSAFSFNAAFYAEGVSLATRMYNKALTGAGEWEAIIVDGVTYAVIEVSGALVLIRLDKLASLTEFGAYRGLRGHFVPKAFGEAVDITKMSIRLEAGVLERTVPEILNGTYSSLRTVQFHTTTSDNTNVIIVK